MHSGRDDWSLGGACVAGVARESSEFCRELGGGADRYDRATSDAGARADHATTDRGGGATSSCTTRRIRAVEDRGLHIDGTDLGAAATPPDSVPGISSPASAQPPQQPDPAGSQQPVATLQPPAPVQTAPPTPAPTPIESGAS